MTSTPVRGGDMEKGGLPAKEGLRDWGTVEKPEGTSPRSLFHLILD